MMGFGSAGMFLFWAAILALLAGGGASLFSQMTSSRRSGDRQRETERQLLDERFARGEVGGDEYEAVRAQIGR